MIVIALSLLAIAADDVVDEVPLVMPVISREEPKAEAPPPLRLVDRGFHLGARATGLIQSGPILGATGGGLEIGYRLPFAGRRLGFVFEPGVLALIASPSAGWLVALPLGLSYHEHVGPGLLRVVAEASLDIGAVAGVQFGSVGAQAGLGYVIGAGPGGVVIDLKYRLLRYRSGSTDYIGHGGTLNVGYAFFL